MRIRGMLAGAALAAGVLGCSGGGGSSEKPGSCRDPSSGKEVDLSTDANNCGSCRNVCPTQPHAGAACNEGKCERGTCEPGWQDLTDEPGCETPSTDLGLVFSAVTAGSTFEAPQGQSARHYLQGSIGEPTPAVDQGEVEARSAGHRNVSGFNAMLH